MTAWYTSVTCPVATCYLTATHSHSDLDLAAAALKAEGLPVAVEVADPVADAAAWIRRRFDKRRRTFLEDPGGWLDYVGADFSDEVAAAAIAIVEGEWGTDVTGQDLLDAVAAATDLPAYVAQTGGGTATIYVGHADPATEDRYPLAIGPGSYSWDNPAASRFGLGDDLWIGPDNHGDSLEFVRSAATLAEVTAAVREILRATGHGDRVTS